MQHLRGALRFLGRYKTCRATQVVTTTNTTTATATRQPLATRIIKTTNTMMVDMITKLATVVVEMATMMNRKPHWPTAVAKTNPSTEVTTTLTQTTHTTKMAATTTATTSIKTTITMAKAVTMTRITAKVTAIMVAAMHRKRNPRRSAILP